MKILKMLSLLLLLAGSATVQAQDRIFNKRVYTHVDKMPEFNGDVSVFLAKNVKYPVAALKANVEGRVIVKFVVAETGKVEAAEVENNVNPMLAAEALRVVRLMPKWRPGTQNGKPVKVYFRLPVTFKLQ